MEYNKEVLMVIFHAQKKIDELLEPSREKSLVMTKLDEARLWASEALAKELVLGKDKDS